MAIAQSEFSTFMGRAYDGQVSTTEVSEIMSRTVEDGLIQFGRAVVRGAGKRSCAPTTAATVAGDVIGFAVRNLAEPSASAPAIPASYETGYPEGHVASVIRRGSMYATCQGGASAGDPVHVIAATGQLAGSGGVELNQVRWIEDVVDGEVGEIQIDGILNVSA